MNAKPRTILLLVGIFLVGVATGVLLPWRVVPGHEMHPKGSRFIMTRMLGQMDRDFQLTAEQRSKIEALLRESTESLDRMRKESFKNAAVAIFDMNAKVEALLTPEQREKFAKMQREQLERMRRFGPDPFGRNREGMPPPPPGVFPGENAPHDGPPGEMPPPPPPQE
jgi:Spy/CpxP family protein refolding chaperone